MAKSPNRVRVRSSRCRDHGHNPKICDLIVCWEHNWIDCPVEVVEVGKSLMILMVKASNNRLKLAAPLSGSH